MNKLQNYALGQWVAGADNGQELFNAITGDVIATASSKGLDFAKMCEYARSVGGPNLRKLTFQQRGLMLKALAMHLLSKKEEFYKIISENDVPKKALKGNLKFFYIFGNDEKINLDTAKLFYIYNEDQDIHYFFKRGK